MKRAMSMAAALGVASALVAMPLQATAAKETIVLEDPLGDANFVNDQGTGDGSFGDFNQADAGTVSDLLKIGLRNDAKNLYVRFETEAAPPALTGVGMRLRVNPDGTGGTYCIYFEAFFQGANNNLDRGYAHVRDACAGGDPVPVDILGTTLVVPRDINEAFAKGATLAATQAQSYLYSGTYPTGVVGPFVDTTKVGADYKFKK